MTYADQRACKEVFGFDPSESEGGPIIHPAHLQALPDWQVNWAKACELCHHRTAGAHDRCPGCRRA